MRNRKDYDYYIFIDYSDDLIGCSIIKEKNIKDLLSKISRFRHYKSQKNRKIYLNKIKETIKRQNITGHFEMINIEKIQKNLNLISDVLEFIKRNENCLIFLSIDDHQFKKLRKIISLIDGEKVDILKESQLKKGTPEYQVNLVLDNLLNIKRRDKKEG